MAPEFDYFFNFLLVGDAFVGKSSLHSRFVDGKFDRDERHTIGSNFINKTIYLEGKKIKLQIWDTAGQERYRTIVLSHFRRAHGIIVIYDVTNQKTFDSVKKWFEEVDRLAPKTVNRILVGNKCDSETFQRDVDYETAKEFADQLGIPFLETSARDGTNVEEMFITMVAGIKRRLFPSTSAADASHQERNVNSSTPVKTQIANESMKADADKQNKDSSSGSCTNVKCEDAKIASAGTEAVANKQNEDTSSGSCSNVKCQDVKSAAAKPPSSVSTWSKMLSSIASFFKRRNKDHGLIVDEGMEAVADIQTEDTPSGSCSDDECQDKKSFQTLILNLKQLFITGKHSDFTIKVKDREFKVHRGILATRSSVFDTMFSHDLSGNNSVFPIEDCEPAVFEEFLYFVYAGKTEHLSSDNAGELFYLADKYDLAELKEECINFLKKFLSIETICDVICLSAKHNETELLELAKEFFTRNLEKVLVTPKWQLFLKENPTEANELIIKAHKSGYTQKNV